MHVTICLFCWFCNVSHANKFASSFTDHSQDSKLLQISSNNIAILEHTLHNLNVTQCIQLYSKA